MTEVPEFGKIVSTSHRIPKLEFGNGLTRSLTYLSEQESISLQENTSLRICPSWCISLMKTWIPIIAFPALDDPLCTGRQNRRSGFEPSSSRNFVSGCFQTISFSGETTWILDTTNQLEWESIWPCISSNVLPVTARDFGKRWTFWTENLWDSFGGEMWWEMIMVKWLHAQSYAGWRNRYREMDWRRIWKKLVKFELYQTDPHWEIQWFLLRKLTDEEAKPFHMFTCVPFPKSNTLSVRIIKLFILIIKAGYSRLYYFNPVKILFQRFATFCDANIFITAR